MIALPDEAAADALGAAIADLLRPGDAIALSGPLGAGKTTLARGILRGLGLAGEAPSPSFPIVIAYAPPELRLPLWHVDLYRIEDADEIDELGLDDARTDSVLLIEWPERMGGRLWPDMLRLALDDVADGGRRLTWVAPDAWDGRWPPPRR
ncbi:tRNA (adenosine(37)-N6)-threonylcarbamoyltransferase complex ATPase subunit type 1 TsaE [Sphingomonas nostoxanthinifaciens]|uniref:tRNA (adenosine(37)-N6)-threonylcarbamoyltransferase complex ATPase subunit type 1 TsaE n=1 Tax=Sphingomonas nostoxanthinifaciens TaxID=2872652 RepID=UPI001CC1EA0A|nr:tRNA (adenosine(37)-N6)-threonylcarbamoyltransferase complex ATPase subunit type 1 TsaE [Sphingomonas nostoxanthinifaciens]UAK25376.1 tRNA (adenosine(37)-N6)-threonylcarbamoyltransferase complex ATPase subunit type 1 TsaE [Sphingomonas nostoxanthinifaciens]